MRSQRTILIAVAICSILTLSCRPAAAPERARAAHARALQAIVDDIVAGNETVPAAALWVDAPTLGLVWEGAAGVVEWGSSAAMTPLHPLELASNTKTYIAASILRLWEDGRLELDDPISEHLPAEYVDLLTSDGYDTGQITVRHLLTHTGGLYDYADREIYPAKLLADPTHRWTRTEQLEAAVAWGDPLGAPGEVYCYSDTGYILLGSMLEEITGEAMPAAVRELVGYERNGLGSTWFLTLEDRPDGVPELAHQYFGEVDATTIDPSSDLYGGGGLAASVGDLGRFMKALFSEGVYAKPETLEMMLTTVDGARARAEGEASNLSPGDYRMGVWEVEVEGLTSYRHSGFWGTIATFVPELELTIAATVNQNQCKPALNGIVTRTVLLVRDATEGDRTPP
jgi:D-alanyl-D-alanine carboxypeptidase